MKLLRIAIVLQVAGLLVEALSIVRLRPITFLLFAGISLPCIVIGILLYFSLMLRGLTRAARAVAGAPRPGGETTGRP